ncbi:hypothetical protein O3P69_018974 [Scylla paramamosain]|uniref:Fucosyltransferase n=1 Tax=Scylla paramamosain TaxID=85552 RepID=A0AAW0S9T6_SCYPA
MRRGYVVLMVMVTVTLGTLCGFLSINTMQSARLPRGRSTDWGRGCGVSTTQAHPHLDIVLGRAELLLVANLFQTLPYLVHPIRQVSRQCPESRCELVYDHRLLDSASAVLFHQGDMEPLSLPETRLPGQPWIFLSFESPYTVVSRVNLARLNGVINWTMTYCTDETPMWWCRTASCCLAPLPSTLSLAYLTATPTQGHSSLLTEKDYWAGKSKRLLAAWTVSHCNTESRRELFVKEMVKHMAVDVFGRCGTKKCGKSLFLMTIGTFNQTKCNNEIEKYMFYLAFENAICLDYITEKFYQALTLEVVPVVLGGGPYEDIAPPHSYVDALAFPSPKHLAKYLKEVANDRDAYNRFFAWKQHYTVELGHPFSPLVCDLCAKLHDPASFSPPNASRNPMEQAEVMEAVRGRDGNGSYPDIQSWFVRSSGCRRWWESAEGRRKHIRKY